MDRPYVEWVRIEGYRCIKSADLHLTPLHALIGPNDSGKSSILRAIYGSHGTTWWDSERVGWVKGTITAAGGLDEIKEVGLGSYDGWDEEPLSQMPWPAELVAPRAVLRLDPDAMRAAVPLIAHGRRLWFQDEKGLGLPALYDALLSRDLSGFSAINDHFRTLFPTARAIRLHNASSTNKQLGLTLADGKEVGPAEMSEGMLYWLAFAIIEHLAPQAMLLIEEPENGLHPARIKEVMRVLREVSQRTQIILATHSPLVINELQPEEATIVTRTAERGTICTPMTETKHFQTRKEIYALGELWLSFADGDLERDLVPDELPAPAASAG